MKLPIDAKVDLAKLRDYCLSLSHPEGKHKARVFFAALGITAEDADWLREELLAAALREECQPGLITEHGRRFTIDFSVRRAHHEAQIRSGWIIRKGENFARLVSCYVLNSLK